MNILPNGREVDKPEGLCRRNPPVASREGFADMKARFHVLGRYAFTLPDLIANGALRPLSDEPDDAEPDDP